MRGEFVPLVVVPGFGIERGVFAGADRIVPLPTRKLAVFGMIVHQDTCAVPSASPCDLLEHRELIGVDRVVFVDGGLDVPASEVAAIGARKCSGAESADGSALPVAVVDVGFVLADAGILRAVGRAGGATRLSEFRRRAGDGISVQKRRSPSKATARFRHRPSERSTTRNLRELEAIDDCRPSRRDLSAAAFGRVRSGREPAASIG